jgi:adenosylmethionine-8-amino-7-oxononanoate aminotransferase
MKIWHPYTQPAIEPPPIPIERGEAAYLYTTDGRRLIDAISSWWLNIHGHAHPRIAEAIAAQARKLEQVIFAGFTHEPAEELAERLGRIVPAGLDRVFYSDNGSTAVEVALKIAIQYWYNFGRRNKNRIVALEHGYHGDTIGAMSVSADSPFTAAFEPLRLHVLRVRNSNELERLFNESAEEIAAMIVEPLVQGAGGMLIYPPSELQRFSALCQAHQVLFIADEVFTGMGRTGRMFACDHADVTPDLMCISKGLTSGFLPFAATLCRDEVYDPFDSKDRSRTFFHGHSYSGNPLGCAAAIATLKIFDQEPVFERIGAIESIHRQRLPEFERHPKVIDARMMGTIAAIELRADDAGYLSDLRARLYEKFIASGVLLRPLGNVVYTVPPYVIRPDDLHYIYDVIRKVLSEL